MSKNKKEEKQSIIEHVYGQIALESEDANIRYLAIHKISDQDVLFKVVLRDDSDENKTTAIAKITDQKKLEILLNQNNEWMKANIRHKIVKQLTEPSLLIKVAIYDTNPEIRDHARSSLTMLDDFAKEKENKKGQ